MSARLDLRGHGAHRRGELQGEAWREPAHELLDGRLSALSRRPGLDTVEAREAEGQALLALMAGDGLQLDDELTGLARALDQAPWKLALVGAFHDLWDRAGDDAPSGTGERTTLYVVGSGPVLGQAVLAGDERTALRAMVVDGVTPDDPITVVTVAGTLGLGGARRGLVLGANHLRSKVARRGTFEGVEVRRALCAPDATHARARLEAPERGGGRFYLVSDGEALFGLESDGPEVVLTRKGPRTAHTHTDHFFDPKLRRSELRSGSDLASTYRRTELSTSVYVQRRPVDPEAVWTFLSELDELRGASGDEERDRSTLNLFGSSALWVARAEDGAVWCRTGLEADDAHLRPPPTQDAEHDHG